MAKKIIEEVNIGDKFIINQKSSDIQFYGYVNYIDHSGKWFTLTGLNNTFSPKTLTSRGRFRIRGLYLERCK